MTSADKKAIKRMIANDVAKFLPGSMKGMRTGTEFHTVHSDGDNFVLVKAVDIFEGEVTYFEVLVKEQW